MSSFCPTCGNALIVRQGAPCSLICRSCPYIHPITTEITFALPLQKKKVDDVLGGEDAWKNVEKTAVPCPKCAHGEAFFMQIQTRSADEPMTTFFKCADVLVCGFRWKE